MIRTLVFLLLLAPLCAAAQFEGTITFRKSGLRDTSNYRYSVKGDKVRIDELNAKSGKVEGSFLVDTKAQTMLFLSPDRKTWGKREQEAAVPLSITPALTVTQNKKNIQGYACTEYVLKSDSTEISFWVAPGKFTFFMPMLKLINRREKFSTWYQALNPKAGSFAFLAVQKENGKETARLEVMSLEKKILPETLFTVPADYKEFK